jgi:hypothetical protein
LSAFFTNSAPTGYIFGLPSQSIDMIDQHRKDAELQAPKIAKPLALLQRPLAKLASSSTQPSTKTTTTLSFSLPEASPTLKIQRTLGVLKLILL